MSHNCADHSHDHATGAERGLGITLGLVAVYFLAELIGGWWTGSLALLADAGHMFSDMASLIISLIAAQLRRRASAGQRTFGYHRAEILAALVNGALLFLVAGGIVHEAWERLWQPVSILAGPMTGIALGGLLVNLVSLRVLHSHRNHNLNLQGAWLHVLGDTLGSVGVILAGLLVWGLGWDWADPAVSILVCLLIAWSAWHFVGESLHVLMEAAPREVDVQQVRTCLLSVPGVLGVHCLHVWTIASGLRAVSAHVVVEESLAPTRALTQSRDALRARFPLEHVTLQIEHPGNPHCEETADGACLGEFL